MTSAAQPIAKQIPFWWREFLPLKSNITEIFPSNNHLQFDRDVNKIERNFLFFFFLFLNCLVQQIKKYFFDSRHKIRVTAPWKLNLSYLDICGFFLLFSLLVVWSGKVACGANDNIHPTLVWPQEYYQDDCRIIHLLSVPEEHLHLLSAEYSSWDVFYLFRDSAVSSACLTASFRLYFPFASPDKSSQTPLQTRLCTQNSTP